MDKKGKNFKLFLGRSDLIGDTVMCEPSLRYFEKIYPNSYKYWHLLGKTSQAASLWLNHPLIDRLKISKNLESYDEEDYEIMRKCDIVINTRPQHKIEDWYNYYNCVEETIQMAGINLDHFNSILTEEERRPKLYKWFKEGLFEEEKVGYCVNETFHTKKIKNIAIQPFCGYGKGLNRSPDAGFWSKLIEKLLSLDYYVYHYGFVNEPSLSSKAGYKKLTHLPFFEQIKAALDSEIIVGGDSGFMWTVGAFSHKAVQLITNWLPNHNRNLLALAPVNINSENIFYDRYGKYPSFDLVIKTIVKKIS